MNTVFLLHVLCFLSKPVVEAIPSNVSRQWKYVCSTIHPDISVVINLLNHTFSKTTDHILIKTIQLKQFFVVKYQFYV